MSDTPDLPAVIDVADPLLEAFTLQHDLRERYFHALQEAKALFDELDLGPGGTPLEEMAFIFGQINVIVRLAIDSDAIKRWQDEGRPLPWLDGRLGDGPEQVRQAVMKMIGLEGE